MKVEISMPFYCHNQLNWFKLDQLPLSLLHIRFKMALNKYNKKIKQFGELK